MPPTAPHPSESSPFLTLFNRPVWVPGTLPKINTLYQKITDTPSQLQSFPNTGPSRSS